MVACPGLDNWAFIFAYANSRFLMAQLIFMMMFITDSCMFVPTFVELDSNDVDVIRKKLLDANVQYPFGKYL